MRITIKVVVGISLISICFAIIYFLGYFISLEKDYHLWTIEGRIIFILTWLASSVISIAFMNLFVDKEF